MDERRLRQECEGHNRTARLVTEDASFSIADFWRLGRGHFLITGSDERERKRLLMRKVADLLDLNDGPVIILTGDEDLQRALMPAFTRADQELWLTTSADPNYHLLFGLNDDGVCAVFRDLARHEGSSNPQDMETYLRAFLTVLRSSQAEAPCLPTMASLLSRYSDAQLITLGQQHGVPEAIAHNLANYGPGGKTLRNLIRSLQDACRSISRPDSFTEHNALIRALHWYRDRHPMVMVISSPGGSPYMFHRVLAAELQRLMDGQRPFHLILHDAAPVPEDGLLEVILRASDKHWDCGVSTGSLTSLLRATRREDENPYGLYPLKALLTDSQPEILTGILNHLPSYEHHEVTTVKTVRRKYFSGEDTISYQVDRTMRPCIRLQDLTGAQALLMGHDGLIPHIVTRLN